LWTEWGDEEIGRGDGEEERGDEEGGRVGCAGGKFIGVKRRWRWDGDGWMDDIIMDCV